MWSKATAENKNAIVASCWTYFTTIKHYVFWVYVCSLRCPAFNAHAPYCHVWPARLYSTFPHYLI